VREKVLLRNLKWEPSHIPMQQRAERFSQRPTLLLITGARDTDRKSLGKDLEARLFQDGRMVYYLGMGSVVYGVDADLDQTANQREHIRRLGEIANILLDAGAILVVTAAELGQDGLELLRTSVDPERIEVVWVGDSVSTDLSYDLILGEAEAAQDGVERIKRLLQDKGVLYRPW
jgi:bifunctional enzyme CysN/CysC